MKKLLSIFCLSIFLLTGCDFKFSEKIFKAETIKTSVYPIEYITEYLYGFEADVESIYPDGADYNSYEVTDKLIENYSASDLLIYNGVSNENKIAVKFLNNNENIQIIDAMQDMKFVNSVEELWLDPSNFLMVASNIKNGLLKLAPNKQTSEKILENYENLKVEVSKIDVELYTLTSLSNYSSIVASNDLFKYLNKYGIEVTVLNENNKNLSNTYNEVKALASKGNIKYIYTLKDEKLPSRLSTFIKDNNITRIEINPLTLITEEDRNNKEDYISIMKENINEIKKELNK